MVISLSFIPIINYLYISFNSFLKIGNLPIILWSIFFLYPRFKYSMFRFYFVPVPSTFWHIKGAQNTLDLRVYEVYYEPHDSWFYTNQNPILIYLCNA